MSQNSESVGIPRGLIARRGTQNASTQRLPSLRCESHSSQAFLTSNSLPITTKGGALKRTFKPTIPVRRNASEDNTTHNDINDNSSKNRRGKQMRNNSRNNNNNNNRGKFDDKPKFIQLDAAVFSGANNPELRSNRLNDMSSNRKSIINETRIKREIKTEKECDKSDQKSNQRHDSKIKLESKEGIIRKLYGDNFLDDNYESDNEVILPKGWESVSGHRVLSQSNVEPLNPYNLLNCEQNEDKLLIMQIPEQFLKRQDGYIGKMRVYKSGRIEMEDKDSGIKFDILFDKSLNLKNVKQENKLSKDINCNSSQDMSQDLVSFVSNNLCVLGDIKHKQVLLAVPQIPLDERIGPSLPL